MTGQQFYEFLYDWAHGVLGSGVPVIQAYQNASQPTTGNYVAIEDDSSWDPCGRADVKQDVLDAGVSETYTVKPKFWDVRGNGDTLRKLRDSLELESVKAQFQAAGVGILDKSGLILTMPYLSPETEFIREHVMTLAFSVNTYQVDATASIATAQLVPQLGA